LERGFKKDGRRLKRGDNLAAGASDQFRAERRKIGQSPPEKILAETATRPSSQTVHEASIMAKDILTPLQQKFISAFSKNKKILESFYLTGGTALAAYYLKHRYSEDLDFFSKVKIDILSIDVFLKGLKSGLGVKKTDFQQSFNRNLFFLHTGREILKTEFTYFPFELIEKPVKKDGIYVNSITDIAADKAFTIAQNPRARDFIDLYLILKKYRNLSLDELLKMTRVKFDWHIDPIQLGTQFLKAKEVKDLPRMLEKINHRDWRDFFVDRARSLSTDIFKK
jgi:predicted nucleotidyltransferase component of viral defense system